MACGIVEMHLVPLVGIFAADAGKVRSGPLGAPEERTVIGEFAGLGILAVAHHLGLQRTHRLGVAVVASFALVDVLARKLQRRIGFEVRELRMHFLGQHRE